MRGARSSLAGLSARGERPALRGLAGSLAWSLLALSVPGSGGAAATSIAGPPDAPAAAVAPAFVTAGVKIPITVASSADVNPDASGKPSPIVLRVYQLKTDAIFSRSEFFALFDDEQKVLGSELVSRDEYVLTPTEHHDVQITLADETRFLGAVAAFRDIRNAQWRATASLPLRGMTIVVERSRVVLIPD